MNTLSAIALLTLVLLSTLAAEARTTVQRDQLRELGAFAEWQYDDEAGSITFVAVLASEFARRTGSVAAPVLAVSVRRIDADGFIMFSGAGSTESFGFTGDSNLTNVRLVGTVPLFDEGSGTFVDFQVDLTVEGTGVLETTQGHVQFREPGFVFVFNFQGQSREATATGTVSGVGINFTPVPSTVALIQRNNSGSILIIVEAPQ